METLTHRGFFFSKKKTTKMRSRNGRCESLGRDKDRRSRRMCGSGRTGFINGVIVETLGSGRSLEMGRGKGSQGW